MKKLIQVLSFLLLAQQGMAQTSERLQLNAGNFVVPQKEALNMFADPFIRQIGLSYTHHINSRFALRGSYMEWFQLLNIGNKGFVLDDYFEPRKQSEDIRLGDIDSRQDYKSIDFSVLYQLLQIKKHELYAGAGISYTWGWYLEYTGIYNYPGYPDWLFELTDRKHKDFGLIAEVGYNYMIGKKKRINIGVSETVRVYTTLPFQFYTNINIGYNFNWGVKKKNNR